MSTAGFELGPGETLVAEYAFPGGGKLGRKATLTSKRLIVLGAKFRETHPLNRIRSVRIESGRNWLSLFFFSACAIIGFAMPMLVTYMGIAASRAKAQVDDLMSQGYVMSGIGIVFGLLCVWGAFLAYRGYVRLAVDLESETKTYAVQNQDPNLLSFVTKVEHSL